MILAGKKVNDNKIEVQGIYVDDSIIINTTNELPERPIEKLGKDVVLFVNPITNELFYDYVDRQLTSTEEEIELLKQQNEELTTMLGDALLGGVL